MPALNIVLHGDGAFAGKRIDHHVTEPATIAALPRGMASGKPSVAIHFELPNGEGVVFETSLQLLLSAADALKARHGAPRA
jgi:hypothetical protein